MNSQKDYTSQVKEELNPPTIPLYKSLLETLSVSESMKLAAQRDIPKQCFSEFIHEGEVVILFADTNTGKSILAVQVGDLVSRGDPGQSFRYEPKEPKKVLYLDCELSDKQFEGRYSNNYIDHYQFSERFFISRINPEHIPEGDFEVALFQSLEHWILDKKIDFLIIDNLTYLRTETEQSKNALPLMKQLKLLKSKYNLTILVLAHTPKRDQSKPIGRNDLAGSKSLINFCDAAFAIGESFHDKSIRYLKQIKARATEVVYDADNVIECEVRKDNNYLKFEFLQYGKESQYLKPSSEDQKKNERDQVAQLHQAGTSVREIAAQLNLSKSKVDRIIQKLKK